MTPPTVRLSLSLLVAALLLGVAAASPLRRPAEGRERLAEMPRERRLALAGRLDAFDALPPEEQARLRDLDRQIAALPPAERGPTLRLLSEYELWLDSLAPDVQRRIEEAPDPEARAELVVRLRSRSRPEPAAARNAQNRLQVSTLAPDSLMLAAIELRCWFSLDARGRETVLARPNLRQQQQELRRLAPPDSEAFRSALEDFLPRFRGAEEKGGPRLGSDQIVRLLEAPRPPPALENLLRRAEANYVRGHEPAPVEPARLARFEAEIPPWLRAGLDLLPPEAARRRLHLLYRLTFPAGTELPEPNPRPA